jgi:hypothetical protein
MENPRFSNRPSRAPKKKELVDANRLFAGLLKKLGYDPESYAVFEIWDRLLGAQASKARAVGLKGPALHVEVDSSARLHDLTLRKRDLLKKLNGHFGTRRPISDIILQLASAQTENRTPKTQR